MSRRLLVFDLDGTLIDSRRDLCAGINLMRQHYGLAPLPVDQVSGYVGDGIRKLVTRALAGFPADLDEAVRLNHQFYREHLHDATTMYSDVSEGLQALAEAGHELAVITNKPEDATRELLRHFKIDGRFSHVIGGDSGFPLKPDPAALLDLMARTHCDPGQTWMIGDHQTDIESGQRAGAHSLFVTYGIGSPGALTPDLTLDSFATVTRHFLSRHPRAIQALVLISGGLDSQLAVKVLQSQGIEVKGVVFKSPFFNGQTALEAARQLNIDVLMEDFTPTLMPLLDQPTHGFGSGLNPCIDCHTAMIRLAGELMRKLGFHFVATGEVLNQRPMSQNPRSLDTVERESGLAGYLVRPLSARALAETLPEKKGWVRRDLLLDLHGRSRKPQMDLARQYGLTHYPQPAGGCLLTDPAYSQRLKELKAHEGLGNASAIARLRMGRHFRIQGLRLIIGRQQSDNEALERGATDHDCVLAPATVKGPVSLIDAHASDEVLRIALSICARYCSTPDAVVVDMEIRGPHGLRTWQAPRFTDAELEPYRI